MGRIVHHSWSGSFNESFFKLTNECRFAGSGRPVKLYDAGAPWTEGETVERLQRVLMIRMRDMRSLESLYMGLNVLFELLTSHGCTS
jgi:hypothetical protein